MGNYTTVWGKIVVSALHYQDLLKYLSQVYVHGFEEPIKFFTITYRETARDYELWFKPNVNFKLLGYPSYFDEFVSLFEDMLPIIEYCKISGYDESHATFVLYLERDLGKLYVNGADEGDIYGRWHSGVISRSNYERGEYVD